MSDLATESSRTRDDSPSSFLPISDYGLIGNCHTAALVSSGGSIDWLCLPRFDSPSLFGRILDSEKGGYWKIAPATASTSTHRYIPETNILETTFDCATGRAVLIDFMDVTHRSKHKAAPGRLIRIIRVLHGTVDLVSCCQPRPDYARELPQFVQRKGAIAFGQFQLVIPAKQKHQCTVESSFVRCNFSLAKGEQTAFALSTTVDGEQPALEPEQALPNTTHFWHEWAQQCTYKGPYRDAVVRSALALKLMIYEPTGAIIAAPTTSLPEKIGGSLNWDYRFTWIRDSSFTLYSLLLAGYLDTGKPYIDWLSKTLDAEGRNIKILYPISSEGRTEEQTLDHLSGYRQSSPVRIGNQAAGQTQLDVYGEVISAIYFAWKTSDFDPTGLWNPIQQILSWVSRHWRDPDSGIWEIRGEQKHYVYSKVMMCMALERGIEMALELNLEGDIDRWQNSAKQLREEILKKGWSEKLGAFKQAYENEVLDASNLLLPIVGFIEGDDCKMVSTIEATIKGLVSNGLCYRYKQQNNQQSSEDETSEGTFVLCTFWLINALVRAGRTKEAEERLEQMLSKSSSLGLFAEEIMPDSGQHVGNFPQAFSHIGVINAAVALAHAGCQGSVQDRHAKAAEAARHQMR